MHLNKALPVILVHYHLDPGGVTQVILSQIKALQALDRPYLVLTGKEYRGDLGVCQHVIPELNYLNKTGNINELAEKVFSLCIEAVSIRFNTEDIIWHFHNPTLGCHDFAEDGRPQNYQVNKSSNRLYPMAPNVHYAFVNNRDRLAATKAGISENQLHTLHNAISENPHHHQLNPLTPPTVVYPVRGIPRKNIGELLLWSVLAPEGSTFVLTSAPKNPEWIHIYQAWEELSKDLDLPVIMDCVGQKNAPGHNSSSFSDWMNSATHCITTSVAEGFGLTFLEPLSQNIPLIGRDLPEITKDFNLQSAPNTSLYQKILIPINAIDLNELKEEFYQSFSQYFAEYGRPITGSTVYEAWNNLIESDWLDFGNLPELFQIFLIIKAKIDNFRDFQVLLSNGEKVNASDWITQALGPKYSFGDPSEHLKNHLPSHYKDQYDKILKVVSNSTKTLPSWLPPEKVLTQYLRPERFNFLMT